MNPFKKAIEKKKGTKPRKIVAALVKKGSKHPDYKATGKSLRRKMEPKIDRARGE